MITELRESAPLRSLLVAARLAPGIRGALPVDPKAQPLLLSLRIPVWLSQSRKEAETSLSLIHI